jgi:hypothetical protein
MGDAFLAGAEASLKSREASAEDDENQRLKAKDSRRTFSCFIATVAYRHATP